MPKNKPYQTFDESGLGALELKCRRCKQPTKRGIIWRGRIICKSCAEYLVDALLGKNKDNFSDKNGPYFVQQVRKRRV